MQNNTLRKEGEKKIYTKQRPGFSCLTWLR